MVCSIFSNLRSAISTAALNGEVTLPLKSKISFWHSPSSSLIEITVFALGARLLVLQLLDAFATAVGPIALYC